MGPPASFAEAEPRDSIDLRDRHSAAGAGRPLDLDLVGSGERRVEVAFDCPGADDLATLERDVAEAERRGVGVGGDRVDLKPGLLEEFALRGCLGRFTVVGDALGDAPAFPVLLLPVRAARVGEQDLEVARVASEQQDPGGDAPAHGGTAAARFAASSGDGSGFALTRNQVSIGPLPLTSMTPRRSNSNVLASRSRVSRVTWSRPGIPVDSIRLAVFTVSPQTS